MRGDLNASIGGVNRSIGSMTSGLNGLGSSLSKIGGDIRGAFEGAVESVASVAEGLVKLGAVAAMGAVTYGVVKLNNELEKTKISLATIFNAEGITNGMEEGLTLSSAVMTRMRKDAAELPGEFEDLVG